ncbi:MAG: heavy metal translocating P-type ATPase [Pontibacterium sp.]
MSQQYTLNVSGMSCQGCVNKVRKLVNAQDTDAQITGEPKENRLEVQTSLALSELADIVNEAGFEYAGEYTDKPTTASTLHTLNVSGMSCQGCVNKVRKLVNAQDEHAQVSGEPKANRLEVESHLSLEALSDIVDEAGFEYLGEYKADADEQTIDAKEQADTASEAHVEDAPLEAHRQFAVTGISCAGCVNTIEKALAASPQVSYAKVNFANHTAQIEASLSDDEVIGIIRDAGYGARALASADEADQSFTQETEASYKAHLKQAALALGLGVPLMLYGFLGGSMQVVSTSDRFVWLAVGLATLAIMFFAGKHFYGNAWRALKHKSTTMDTLVALGTGSAWLYSMVVLVAPSLLPASAHHLYFEATAMIIGLIGLGKAIELKARRSTHQAIASLLNLSPKQATVKRNGEWQSVTVESVVLGDTLLLKAGESVSVDGQVCSGESYLDEALLTGEATPVHKAKGDTLFAGTLNQNGTLEYQATALGKDTQLAKIIALVSQAQNSKPAIASFADRISAVFVPAVIALALINAVVWLLWGPSPAASYVLATSISILIIACPCALGLATPISVMIGMGKAAKAGALIKQANALEQASKIDTVVLDKTGTITQGKPEVTQAVWLNDAVTERQGLAWVKQLESQSSHPLAQALVAYVDKQSTTSLPDRLGQIETQPGLGIVATLNQQPIALGNAALVTAQGVSNEQLANAQARLTPESQAATLIYLSLGQQLLALFAVQDPIKADSAKAIAALQAKGIDVFMLTGDRSESAKPLAAQLKLTGVFAELKPDDKLKHIQALQAKGKVVAMVGDGINDAPALAQADVSFAIGAGSDAAIANADITLRNDSLMGVSKMIGLSQATLTNIKQNLLGAFFYNCLGIPIAAGVLYPSMGLLLSPVVAGAAMSLSSITVVLNANRLRRYNP